MKKSFFLIRVLSPTLSKTKHNHNVSSMRHDCVFVFIIYNEASDFHVGIPLKPNGRGYQKQLEHLQ